MLRFQALGRAFIPVLVWGLWAQAHAQDAAQPTKRIVLVQPEGELARPGLEPSLRIQLRNELEVVVVRRTLAAELPARIAEADGIAQAQDAEWVLWTDELVTRAPDGSEHAVLYLVGKRDGRALIEVVRVPGGEGPDVDRSLALKVHELIGAADGAAFALGNAAPPPVSGPTRQETRRVQVWLEAGAQASSEGSAGLAGDVVLALGPSLSTPAIMIAVPLELTIGLPRSIEHDGDSVRWTELGAAARFKLAAVLGALRLGGGVGAKLGFSDAQGVAASGRRGSSTERIPALLASLDAELMLTTQLGIRALLGIEQRLQRQHFIVEERELGDTGRTVLLGRLSVVWYAF